jgi:hypothetical protein
MSTDKTQINLPYDNYQPTAGNVSKEQALELPSQWFPCKLLSTEKIHISTKQQCTDQCSN